MHSPRVPPSTPLASSSPVPFAGFGTTTIPSTVGGGNESQPHQGRAVRLSTRSSAASADYRRQLGQRATAIKADPPAHLSPVTESTEPGADDASYVAFGSGSPGFPHGQSPGQAALQSSPFDAELKTAFAAAHQEAVNASSSTSSASIAEGGAIDVAMNFCASGSKVEPLTGWQDFGSVDNHIVLASIQLQGGVQVDDDTWHIDMTDNELMHHSHGDTQAALSALHHRIHVALRADSADAPSNHAEVVRIGEPWLGAETKELNNHLNNGSWERIRMSEKPRGRRLHRFVWVYKIKRDGSAKARLCVQGCTLESGVDYDQTFSSTLRYSSARTLFAFAARRRCLVRSIDYVAAYLQGEFIEGEAVYCLMPPGQESRDKDPYICKVVKPIYGIPQAGRRLQRRVFPWMVERMGLRQLDDSDSCVFVYDDPKGKETFVIGLYVDNMQIVHSAELNADGDATDSSSFYHRFITQLRSDWDIVDEGPMIDLLAIEVIYLPDGSIKLHQESYVRKLLAKYLPDGPPASLQRNSLPYSDTVLMDVIIALDSSTAAEPGHPQLVKQYQERIGALLYLATSTRADLAYIVPLFCRAMSRPEPALMLATNRILCYLHRHPSVGLTYEPKPTHVKGYADASWETRSSTSGWTIQWQGCSILWGSRKQGCVALSSCEAEIVALSEATKDMVYVRKLLRGLDENHVSGPSDLATDNMGARSLSYNPEFHDKTKHIERRHFFVRDMVEKFEVSVPFVRTANNWADFFTKPLNAKTFFAMRKILMNEPSLDT